MWALSRREEDPTDIWLWVQCQDVACLRYLLGDPGAPLEAVVAGYREQFAIGASQRVKSSVMDTLGFYLATLHGRLGEIEDELARRVVEAGLPPPPATLYLQRSWRARSTPAAASPSSDTPGSAALLPSPGTADAGLAQVAGLGAELQAHHTSIACRGCAVCGSAGTPAALETYRWLSGMLARVVALVRGLERHATAAAAVAAGGELRGSSGRRRERSESTPTAPATPVAAAVAAAAPGGEPTPRPLLASPSHAAGLLPAVAVAATAAPSSRAPLGGGPPAHLPPLVVPGTPRYPHHLATAGEMGSSAGTPSPLGGGGAHARDAGGIAGHPPRGRHVHPTAGLSGVGGASGPHVTFSPLPATLLHQQHAYRAGAPPHAGAGGSGAFGMLPAASSARPITPGRPFTMSSTLFSPRGEAVFRHSRSVAANSYHSGLSAGSAQGFGAVSGGRDDEEAGATEATPPAAVRGGGALTPPAVALGGVGGAERTAVVASPSAASVGLPVPGDLAGGAAPLLMMQPQQQQLLPFASPATTAVAATVDGSTAARLTGTTPSYAASSLVTPAAAAGWTTRQHHVGAGGGSASGAGTVSGTAAGGLSLTITSSFSSRGLTTPAAPAEPASAGAVLIPAGRHSLLTPAPVPAADVTSAPATAVAAALLRAQPSDSSLDDSMRSGDVAVLLLPAAAVAASAAAPGYYTAAQPGAPPPSTTRSLPGVVRLPSMAETKQSPALLPSFLPVEAPPAALAAVASQPRPPSAAPPPPVSAAPAVGGHLLRPVSTRSSAGGGGVNPFAKSTPEPLKFHPRAAAAAAAPAAPALLSTSTPPTAAVLVASEPRAAAPAALASAQSPHLPPAGAHVLAAHFAGSSDGVAAAADKALLSGGGGGPVTAASGGGGGQLSPLAGMGPAVAADVGAAGKSNGGGFGAHPGGGVPEVGPAGGVGARDGDDGSAGVGARHSRRSGRRRGGGCCMM